MTLAQKVAFYIKDEFKKEFADVHFSGNLMNTILVYPGPENKWYVEIPAQVYDLKYYKKYGVIKYKNNDSYAAKVDETGGFSRQHKGYVENCIKRGIERALAENKKQGTVTVL